MAPAAMIFRLTLTLTSSLPSIAGWLALQGTDLWGLLARCPISNYLRDYRVSVWISGVRHPLNNTLGIFCGAVLAHLPFTDNRSNLYFQANDGLQLTRNEV
jgi:hypothetical protein